MAVSERPSSFSEKMSFGLAYTRAFDANIKGINTNHICGGTTPPIDLEMDQHDFEVGLTY